MAWVSKMFNSTSQSSKEKAKRRLKLVLMHDRTSLSPEVVEKIRRDFVRVLRRYVEIDDDAMNFALDEENRQVALVANIPIKGERKRQSA